MPNINDINTQKKIANAKLQGLSDQKAVIAAGYGEGYARGNAYKLVANSEVQRLIGEGATAIEEKGVASATDIQKFWTETMNDKKISRYDRLKASELLARAKNLFTQKIDITGTVPVTIIDDLNGKEN